MVKKLKWSRGTGNKKYKVVITDTKTKKKKTMEEIDNRWKARFHEFTSKYQNQKKEPAPAPAPKPINKPPPTPPIAIPARTLGRFNAPMW